MTGYRADLRIKVNRRWEELERRTASDFLLSPDGVIYTMGVIKQQAEKVQQLESKVEQDAPKVLFADAVASSESSCLIGELAKILNQNGVNIGQNRLFEVLRQKNYLCSTGERRNQPTQQSMDLGLFFVKKTSINNLDGSIRVTTTTKVTGKGQQYFIDKFLNNKIAS